VCVESFAPGKGLLKRPIASVSMLGAPASVSWSAKPDGVHIDVPEGAPDGSTVFKVELAS